MLTEITEMEADGQKGNVKSNRVNNEFLVIKKRSEEKLHGEVIAKLASSLFYVHKEASIVDLSTDLGHHEEIMAVGVVDDYDNYIGLIIRRGLFDLLGKPYGRDVMRHKTVERVMKDVLTFDKDRNIFSLASELGDLLKQNKTIHFVLKQGDSFYGSFTSRDMLIYLSDITQKDINLARTLQQSIVKEENIINTDKLKIIGGTMMAKGVGGDFYDVKKFDKKRWLLTIADVSGKGVSASLVTTSMSGMYNTYDFRSGISGFIQLFNDYIQTSFEGQKFVTGLIGEFNEETGDFLFYDMGHSYIYIYRKDKLFRLKTSGSNLPMGIVPGITPAADRIKLEKGDVLVLITDGIAEQINGKKEEYGDKRLSDIIRKHKSKGLLEVKNKLFSDIFAFRGNQPQHDDMTLILAHY